MFFRRRKQTVLSDVPRELGEIGPTLGAAMEQFGRALGRHTARRKARQPRSGSLPARLPSPHWQRPLSHPLMLPERLVSGVAPTVLTRRRGRTGKPRYAQEIEAGAERFADRIRRRLRALREWLGGITRLFRRRRPTRLPARWSPTRSRPTRFIPIARASTRVGAAQNSGADRLLSGLVLVTTAALGWDLTGPHDWASVDRSHAVESVAAVAPIPIDILEKRVERMARAIATAEGYYATGPHDGRTLPYLLNNPGSLKKPARGTADLPTWEDTGLVVFPTSEMGWDALRYQVRLMLSGKSRIYDPSDTWLHVADKYADGDLNWGINVASTLRVEPDTTLEELTPGDHW